MGKSQGQALVGVSQSETLSAKDFRLRANGGNFLQE